MSVASTVKPPSLSKDSLSGEVVAAPASDNGNESPEDGHESPEDGLEGQDAPPARSIRGIRWILVVMSILSCVFLFALDNTVVADVQPAIVNRFHDLDLLPWLSVAFLLASASTLLVWGKLYGLFNCKWLYVLATTVFEIGSAVCGAAPSMNSLIVGRAIAGMGGVGMYMGCMTTISMLTSPKERPTYLGIVGLVWGAGTVLGPVVGGAFTDSSATWRWAFYINLCIGAVFAPVFIFLIPSLDPRPGTSYRARLREIDWLGPILFAGFYVTGIMAISFGGAVYAWNSSTIIGLFVGSGVLFALFFLQQSFKFCTNFASRIFPLQYLRNKEMVLIWVLAACAATAAFVPVYFVPLYFQFVKADGALEAGLRLLPLIVPMVVFNVVNGVGMTLTGYYMPWYVGGSALALIGAAILQVTSVSTPTGQVYAALVLAGIGAGTFSQASFSVAQSLVSPREIPSAVSFITCAQVTGPAISLSIANTLFVNLATSRVQRLLPNEARSQVQALISSGNESLFNRLKPSLRTEVIGAIVKAITNSLTVMLVAAALALVLSVFLRRGKMQHMDPAAAEEPQESGESDEKA